MKNYKNVYAAVKYEDEINDFAQGCNNREVKSITEALKNAEYKFYGYAVRYYFDKEGQPIGYKVFGDKYGRKK